MVWGNFNERAVGKSESDCVAGYPTTHRDGCDAIDAVETKRGNIHTFVPFVFFVRLGGLVRVGHRFIIDSSIAHCRHHAGIHFIASSSISIDRVVRRCGGIEID